MVIIKRGDGITNKAPEIVAAVKEAQRLLGITSDGQFGEGTEKTVQAFQTKMGIPATGIVNDATWAALQPKPEAPVTGFEFPFTKAKFIAFLGANAAQYWDATATTLPTYKITTLNRTAMFLAQCSHESNGFKAGVENLNYSAEQLQKVFPKYFDVVTATKCARKPEAIANRVYGGRMGNGPEASGDGFRYRGRGILQLTGKDNYTAASKAIFKDDTLVKNPDLASTVDVSVKVAGWFWNSRDLNKYSDAGDIKEVTRRINGGYIGLEHRTKLYEEALKVLK